MPSLTYLASPALHRETNRGALAPKGCRVHSTHVGCTPTASGLCEQVLGQVAEHLPKLPSLWTCFLQHLDISVNRVKGRGDIIGMLQYFVFWK